MNVEHHANHIDVVHIPVVLGVTVSVPVCAARRSPSSMTYSLHMHTPALDEHSVSVCISVGYRALLAVKLLMDLFNRKFFAVDVHCTKSLLLKLFAHVSQDPSLHARITSQKD